MNKILTFLTITTVFLLAKMATASPEIWEAARKCQTNILQDMFAKLSAAEKAEVQGFTLDGEVKMVRSLMLDCLVGSEQVGEVVLNDSLWLATQQYGIHVFDLSEVEAWLLAPSSSQPLPTNAFTDEKWMKGRGWSSNMFINTIFKDRENNIWIGLEAGKFFGIGGLVKFEPGNIEEPESQWKFFTKESGLPSNRIREITELPNGTIRVKTARGFATVSQGKINYNGPAIRTWKDTAKDAAEIGGTVVVGAGYLGLGALYVASIIIDSQREVQERQVLLDHMYGNDAAGQLKYFFSH